MYGGYRCRICGEVYLGDKKPTQCPYCGARARYLVNLEREEFNRLKPDKVTDNDLDMIKKAIKLEVDNAKFYYCAGDETQDEDEAETFERLGGIEEQHAKALANIAEIDRRNIGSTKSCSEEARENYTDAHDREERAIQRYGEFARRADEPEVEEFFRAIIEIEKDHLDLSERKT